MRVQTSEAGKLGTGKMGGQITCCVQVCGVEREREGERVETRLY